MNLSHGHGQAMSRCTALPLHFATEKQVPDPAVLEVCKDGTHHIDEDLTLGAEGNSFPSLWKRELYQYSSPKPPVPSVVFIKCHKFLQSINFLVTYGHQLVKMRFPVCSWIYIYI